MDAVITLIADPVKEPLSKTFVESMAPSLGVLGWEVDGYRWLAVEQACDIFLPCGDDLTALDGAVSKIVADQPYDAVVQPVAMRKKKMLISDMDSTMITAECIDELADYVGCKAQVSEITEQAMRGELDFEAALNQRVALLEGLPEAILEECYHERITLMAGAKRLVATMRAHGARCILVSGGFTFFTQRVSAALGMQADYANQLEMRNGALTGKVVLPILGKQAKLDTLHAECTALGIAADDVLAVGDGANDLPMLLGAGMGIAYHAKPVVRAQAAGRINITDLSSLLFIQGYSKDEWASV